MHLGRVVGRVWSSVKNPGLAGQRLLLVQPLDANQAPSGKHLICADGTGGAGAGELVYWVRGREASFPFKDSDVPSDATIVGIVDELNFGKRRAVD
jgi:microcompartment protein CcmK/EutM